jgi:hypothetical protein
MSQAAIPPPLWEDIFASAVHIFHRLPPKTNLTFSKTLPSSTRLPLSRLASFLECRRRQKDSPIEIKAPPQKGKVSVFVRKPALSFPFLTMKQASAFYELLSKISHQSKSVPSTAPQAPPVQVFYDCDQFPGPLEGQSSPSD